MFVMNDDLSIYATRGDIVFFSVTADDNGILYKFQPGDIVRMAIYGKKDAETCVMQKDFPVEEVTERVFIYLEEEDTKIGDIISKHKDYWYEVVLNPDTMPQTIIGYDEDGAKVFRLFPESEEIDDDYKPKEEDFPVVDSELDMTSPRPVSNSAIARAVATILDVCERTNQAVAEKFVTLQMFGAIGDGEADDTEPLMNAFEYASKNNYSVVFPKGTYLVTCPIVIPSGLDVSGVNAIICKKNDTTTSVNGTDVNAVFVLTGSKTYLHDIHIQGNVGVGVDGIAFDEKAFMMSFCRVTLQNCRKCFNDIGGLFMAEFERVHCISSLNAFVFDTNREKTSITLKNCWAENCGQAYYFYRCQYTNLISCGADYCNTDEDSPYMNGYGDNATNLGVYHFTLCRAVAMNGCGVENCWGNGAVCCSASYLTINGLVCTNVKSRFVANPSQKAVGMIVHGSEASNIVINSLFTNNDFENLYVTETYPNADQYLIAYNYATSVYGARNGKGIVASGLHSYSAPLLGGIGDYAADCLLLDEYGEVVTVDKHLNLGGRKFYPVRNLTHASGSNKLIIPFNSQSSANRVHLIRVTGLNSVNNSNIPNAFEFTLEIASLSTVNHATIIQKSSDAMSVDVSGMNAVVTLPASYTSLYVSIETMSVKDNLINLEGVKLG
jgi:hypothetical protein